MLQVLYHVPAVPRFVYNKLQKACKAAATTAAAMAAAAGGAAAVGGVAGAGGSVGMQDVAASAPEGGGGAGMQEAVASVEEGAGAAIVKGVGKGEEVGNMLEVLEEQLKVCRRSSL